MTSKFGFIFGLFLALSACSEGETLGVADSALQTQIELEAGKKQSANFLAYVHTIDIDIQLNKLSTVHKKIIAECEKDDKYNCSVLNERYRSGDYASSEIQLRVRPEGVTYFSELASQGGEFASQSRIAEDLAVSIFDNAKRIEQLERYRSKLAELESKPDADIDSLLKIAAELASTQTQLEQLQGSREKMLERVKMDILNIHLSALDNGGFYTPVKDTVSDFGEIFAEAIASLIHAIAYIVPWSIFLLLFFFILRALFRFFNAVLFHKKS